MATIQAGGIGSGIEVNSLIEQLVAAERLGPTTILDNRQEKLQTSITAFGSLKSALSSFDSKLTDLKDINKANAKNVSSSHESILTGTADNNANPGSYSVVVSAIAQAHKLSTQASFNDSVEEVGRGTLDISVGAESFQVVIDTSNDQLTQIRDAINNSANNKGVTASLLTVDGGTKLVLTSEKTGTDSQISVSVTGDSDGNDTDDQGLSRLITAELDTITPATNASITIDTLLVTSQTNTIDGAIQGVALDLKTADVGQTVTVSITNDTSAVKERITDFVDSYNELVATMNALGDSDTESESVGLLVGDPTLRTILFEIRKIMSQPVEGISGDVNALAAIGVTTERDGSLKINTDTNKVKLDDILASDFDAVGNIFAADKGYANTLSDLIESYTQSSGIIDTRTGGMEKQLEDISTEREELDRRIEKLEQRLLAQFTAMDQLVSGLKSTGEFLTQQFNLLSQDK